MVGSVGIALWWAVHGLLVLAEADVAFVPAVALHVLSPFLWVPAAAIAAMLWALKGRLSAILATAVAVTGLLLSLPSLPRQGPDDGVPMRIISGNALSANDLPEAWLDSVAAHKPDVLVVLELSPDMARALDEPAWRSSHRHRLVQAQRDNFGIGLYSRWPITDGRIEPLAARGIPAVHATVRPTGASSSVRVIGLHTMPPIGSRMIRLRADQLDQITRWLGEPGPLVAVGDLNLTVHEPAYRGLLPRGVRDGWNDCGSPFQGTWPAAVGPLALRIDHALYSERLGCASVEAIAGPGSDHHPVLVDVIVP